MEERERYRKREKETIGSVKSLLGITTCIQRRLSFMELKCFLILQDTHRTSYNPQLYCTLFAH